MRLQQEARDDLKNGCPEQKIPCENLIDEYEKATGRYSSVAAKRKKIKELEIYFKPLTLKVKT